MSLRSAGSPQGTPRRVPKIKDLHMMMFEDKPDDPAIEEWIEAYERAIRREVLFNESVWSDKMKANAMTAFFGKVPLEWYGGIVRMRGGIEPGYEELKSALKERFRCKETEKTLIRRIQALRRPRGQTFQRFADRLNNIAKRSDLNLSAVVLETFCENASPRYEGLLRSKLRLKPEGDLPMSTLDGLVSTLIQISGNNGSEATADNEGKVTVNNLKGFKKKPEKVKKKGCFHCGEEGHWKRNCPKRTAGGRANRGALEKEFQEFLRWKNSKGNGNAEAKLQNFQKGN